jgi:uncharacterized protein (TIRG00374 family)
VTLQSFLKRIRLPGWAVGGARLAVVLAAVLFLARGVAWDQVARALRDASLPLLAAVVGLNAVMMAVKAVRLRLLLDRRSTFAVCALAKLTASAMNNVTPFRGGDLARVWMLERHAGVSKSAAAVVAIVEQLFEAIALSAMTAVAVCLVPGQRWAMLAAPSVLVLSVAILVLAGRAGTGEQVAPSRPEPGRGATLLGRLRSRIAPAVSVLREGRVTGISLALSVVDWILEASMVVLCARAIGLPIPVPLAFVVLLGINAAMLLPSMPASAGAFEAGATLVLVLAGIPKPTAVAFALLYHLVQVVPVTLAGLLVSLRVGFTLGGLPARPAEASSRSHSTR